MIILPEDRYLLPLLPDADLRQFIEALFSEEDDDDVIDLSPLARMAYETVKSKSNRISQKQRDFAAKQSEKGKKGGAPDGNQNAKKQPETSQNKLNNPKQAKQAETSLTDSDSDSSTDSDSDSKIVSNIHETPTLVHFASENGRERHEADPLFEKFWEAYPRKESRKAAWEKFKRLKPNDLMLQKMLNWLAVARNSDQWQDKRFIPLPATWLFQRRWEGDTPPMGCMIRAPAVPRRDEAREYLESLIAIGGES